MTESGEWKPKSHWDDHPEYTVAEWHDDVINCNTRESYVQWVNNCIKQEEYSDEWQCDECGHFNKTTAEECYNCYAPIGE